MYKVSVVLLAGLLLAGCSGEDNVGTPVNFPPTITFTTNRIVLEKGIYHLLTVGVGDENADDQLTVSWEITSGTLTAHNAQKTIMRWDPLATVGVDTVRVFVSDGKESASVEEVIKRGTRTEETVARARFTIDHSPYILAPRNNPASLLVSQNSTTTIDPGVEIYIDVQECNIDVLGTLQTEGTEAQPILIRPNDRRLRCGGGRGWWDGIQARSEDQYNGAINLRHTEVSYGEHNVRLSERATADIRDCKIVCAARAGVRITGAGKLIVRDSEISNCENHGVEVSGTSSLPESVLVTGCEITFNGNDGFHLEIPDYTQVVPIIITYNLIQYNSVNGITVYSSAFPEIHWNEIWYNNLGAESNIRLMPPYPFPAVRDTLYATNNYWGGYNNAPAIEATITDRADNSSIGTRVIVDPWLVSSPLP